ncbi:LysR family transcriptional regulator [Undibacterium arcticum]|uniref:LysR family transcriptional regulator n=1 Tax=Undibacterium arcticum TaxID=1762892 RepID=A0ABV7EYP2_9BURK
MTMALEANDLLLFARVADEGSFSRAAERLGLPKSTVSRRVAALESQLGERLLLRTTRKLTVTDFGTGILAHAHQVAAEVDAALALAQHRQSEPSGRLRVSMPHDLANTVLGPALATFVLKYPALTLELDLSSRRVDLIGENFDVALRMGALPDDASLAARQLTVFSHGMYASPDYLRQRGMPDTPEQLMQHDALHLLGRSGETLPWVMHRDGVAWHGEPPVRAAINAPDQLLRLALAGAGIARLIDRFAEPYVGRGELLPVLPDWDLPTSTAWAVFAGRRLMPSRTRVFIDMVVAEFSRPECVENETDTAQITRARRLAAISRREKK